MTMRGLIKLTLAGLLLFSAAWAQVPGAAIDTVQINNYLARQVETTRIPGLVAMVTDESEVLYSAAYGRRDVGRDIAMSRDTIFRIASMTKPVTSLAVMMLIEDGLLALEDPVADYLPELADPPVFDGFAQDENGYLTRAAARSITVRHLLTNTSGIGYGFSNEVLSRLEGDRPNEIFPLVHEPGARWTYGASTRVLGWLVEELSGIPLERFFRERIFEPLGMETTFYTVPSANTGRVTTVHRLTEDGLVEQQNPEEITSPANGDGGLHSTAGDYIRFIQLFLRGGRTESGEQLVSEPTIDRMAANHIGDLRIVEQPAANPALTRPFPLGAGRDSFGLGFQITGEHENSDLRRPGSLSWAGIFNTQFWIDPASGIGAVLLMQYLPFYDEAAIDTLLGFEGMVYPPLLE